MLFVLIKVTARTKRHKVNDSSLQLSCMSSTHNDYLQKLQTFQFVQKTAWKTLVNCVSLRKLFTDERKTAFL